MCMYMYMYIDNLYILLLQLHVLLSEVGSDIKYEVPCDEETDTDSDDTNLSDTDPEDEWDTPVCMARV